MSIRNISAEGSWFIEFNTPFSWHVRGVKRVLYSGTTKYQRVAVVEFEDLGKALILDGKVQSSFYDEFVYHESLVHPVMITHPNPRRVLILGGGEGATAREVLRHRSVEEVVMVDIDNEVLRLVKEYLPEMSQGVFEDSRFKLVIDDGRKFLERSRDKYDVIILDLTDPLEGGPSYLLYTVEFYSIVRDRLSDDGLMVTQATSTSYSLRTFATIYRTIASVFPIARAYQVYMHSFDSTWGFVIGSKRLDPASLSLEDVNGRIRERIGKELRFYEGDIHRALFALPKHIRAVLEDKSIMPATDKNPTFLPA
ncbi:polyamine aminopropyltransferase [Vulcanisaeta souniana]|uniref:Polyamine aminopropyltransferase n=1 Tax=Vulcanisaeta souniana JCM 11219 TaxID=1293586 RepID=A0A830E6F5_9CREN|nr:polyamine aminopropyltransferase [Vulcanisaeta souniana]BDR93321.1 spermidine synthase [Vulcanisaeta souniana JCM 11219]GGI76213.1 spermidine synthase [Vulcanisaeta souniana JCM 11219]